jgi:hypothetical protein
MNPSEDEDTAQNSGDTATDHAAVSLEATQTDPPLSDAVANEQVLSESRRHTRRAFLVAAGAATAAYGAYRYLYHDTDDAMQPPPIRNAFRFNADASRAVFDADALAPTYPLSRARDLRVNGIYGLKDMLEPDSYRLQVVGVRDGHEKSEFVADVTAWEYRYTTAADRESAGDDTKVDPNMLTAEKMAPASMMQAAIKDEARTGRPRRGSEEAGESQSTLHAGTPGLLLTMADIQVLPRHELVTQFKCIEGWSQIVHWAGVRMRDFLESYPPALISSQEPRFVYMETPNGDYYTGYDLAALRHPQALLVTEMMGAPLTQFHGAPLRLHMPTKYGYKQIKRIGLIAYTNIKPDDYWTKLGYDWFAGL